MNYDDFLRSKQLIVQPSGIEVELDDINPILFPFQRDITKWALSKGRAAIFADTGLGKTFMQVEWARHVVRSEAARVLIVAPLAVAQQTVQEAARLDVDVHYARADDGHPIQITNYEMVEHFDPGAFGGVVLDESSILKAIDGKTRQKLTDWFAQTPFRLCCTATPAPNDIAEIANHSAFLGYMTRAEMMAAFFVHMSSPSSFWRLKGHAVDVFYRWLSSWGISVKLPSDLGYDDAGFALPPLETFHHYVTSDYVPEGQLFFTGLKGIQDRIAVRRATLESRVEKASQIINGSSEQWLVWVGLNDEGRAIASRLEGSVLVEGKDSLDTKRAALLGFQSGEHRVLVTKQKIAGFGMNFQNCHRMLFLGLNDSWEGYYQAVRRCYRFGQDSQVDVHVVLADVESGVLDNVLRKEKEAIKMSDELLKHTKEHSARELQAEPTQEWSYTEDESGGDGWQLMLGDSTERMAEIADESVDLSVFSPPFISLYTYSPTERDLGNSQSDDVFYEHFGYIIAHLFRTTKPGRNCAVHVAQVPTLKHRDGYIGLRDFRGDVIRAFQDAGWIYYSEVTIDKNPQSQAIRTKAKKLMFVQKNKDSAASAPALADYLLIFQKPGDNVVPIITDVTNDEWIRFAHPVWYDIRETEVLNTKVAKANEDERHIAPLQLEVIRRCLRLWSNPGELICSPFAGIGSEGVVSIELGRRFVGIELKPEYYRTAAANLKVASKLNDTPDLFEWAEAQDALAAE